MEREFQERQFSIRLDWRCYFSDECRAHRPVKCFCMRVALDSDLFNTEPRRGFDRMRPQSFSHTTIHRSRFDEEVQQLGVSSKHAQAIETNDTALLLKNKVW